MGLPSSAHRIFTRTPGSCLRKKSRFGINDGTHFPKLSPANPEIYEPAHRSALYRRIAKIGAVSLNTARSLVQLYWRGGKTKAALAPRFRSRGAPGILREPSEKKLGRPRAEGREFLGLNLTRSEKRAILSVSRAEYRRLGKRRISTCYNRWLDLYFHEDGFNEKGQPARVPKAEYALTGLPTLEQFKRVYYLLTDLIESMRKRNPREFALKYRPLTGTATAETWGPGSRFLIDATMADIHLVSRDNRNRKVGRPVIYVVIDVWSRLIVGIYVAIEDASWTSAMMALSNAACSKVAFCAAHGIEINEDDWPAANIGARCCRIMVRSTARSPTAWLCISTACSRLQAWGVET
jgi:hypothetical protein